jgi:hypothetical protein
MHSSNRCPVRPNPRYAKLAAMTLISMGLLLLVWVLTWPNTAPGQMTLQITGIRPTATNILHVSTTFSNATSRLLNLLDAVDGHPAYIIEPDPKLGLRYFPLTHLSNSFKLNLAPGATLADNFWITNPPPRFRIVVGLRDPGAERGLCSGIRSNLVSSRLGKTLEDADIIKPPPPQLSSRLPPAKSVWVESKPPDLPLPLPSQTNPLPLLRK